MTDETKVTLDSLSDEEYKKAKDSAHEKFKNLFNGKIRQVITDNIGNKQIKGLFKGF